MTKMKAVCLRCVIFSEARAALTTLKNYLHQNDYSQIGLKAVSNLEKKTFSLFVDEKKKLIYLFKNNLYVLFFKILYN